uniref:uncharacterized protein LOC122584043 n=1 Tax=Erigeron canadensis TaxID=72917 RepID=UPI001CB8CC4F|nr:uncharacterized protein LOC122584043 [Erigeron canadensis]
MEYSFPSRGMLWPPNLKILSLGFLKKPMSKWGIQNYPPSLVQLLLCGGGAVDSFGIIREGHNDTISSSCFLLPPSLTYLEIWGFPQVESISEVLQHHPHLQQVVVFNCPKLTDNPPEITSWVANDFGFVRY